MTKLEQIREIIIKNNPSILDLVFGCYISGEGLHNALLVRNLPETDNHYHFEVFVGGYEIRRRVYFKDNMKIIGRTITLSDVLRAIESKHNMPIQTMGIYEEDEHPLYDLMDVWNLSDNNLNNQSKETISFIYKILG